VAGQNQRLVGAQFLAKLFSAFAAIALLLAVVAIYGVTAYAVQQRERETAIRMALGASADAVVRLFLKEAGAVLAAGMALGLVAAVTAARILDSQLYGVRGTDVVTLAVTGLFLASAGVFATWWPARQATLRDPITSLKEG
jgi:ABC-type antimicrobial peptide transport system permease subunit